MAQKISHSHSASTSVKEKLTVEERFRLLEATHVFESMERRILEQIAGHMEESVYPSGQPVVTEGEQGDRLFVIAEGQAEVSMVAGDDRVVLCILDEGELFGEIAFMTSNHRRTHTVTAVTDLRVLALRAEIVDRLIQDHIGFSDALAQMAEAHTRVTFLKRYSPFKSLSAAELKTLLERLETVEVEAGVDILKQGEPGDTCFLLLSGKVDVLIKDGDSPPRKAATLYPGCILGEIALLTDMPRSATVRAMLPCELLAMKRTHLFEVLSDHDQLARDIVKMVRQRGRPQRVDGVRVQEQKTLEGDKIYILSHPTRGVYTRLSSEGWFIWQRLDGRHTLRDLVLELQAERKILVPDKVSATVADLIRLGFVKTKQLRPGVLPKKSSVPWLQSTLAIAHRIMEWHVMWKGADRFLSGLYRWGGRVLFTKTGQVLLGLLSVCGIVSFVFAYARVVPVLRDPEQTGLLPLFVFIGAYATMIPHETAHGLTVKHFGHKIRGAGVGWYWFGPMAFVDSSDMWTAARWPRIAVSLAGPYANLLLGAVAAIGAYLSPNLLLAAGLWQFAVLSGIMVIVNLNPLLEYDGYYVLADALDRPNLRQRTLEWLGRRMPRVIGDPKEMRRHWFELLYGISSIGFVGLMAYLAIASYRVVLEIHLLKILPPFLAWILPWAFAGLLVVSAAMRITGELRVIPSTNEGQLSP